MSTTPAATPHIATGTWTVDAGHSTIGFVVRHVMVAKVRGHFTSFSGTITIAQDALQSKVDASVEAASITTGDEARDGHLKSADFFEVETHPTWTLVSTGITPKGDDFVLAADLTIRGVTRPVEFDLEFAGVATDPWGNTKAGFSAETEISRKDFGLEWNAALETGGVLVGDKVKITLDIEALKA